VGGSACRAVQRPLVVECFLVSLSREVIAQSSFQTQRSTTSRTSCTRARGIERAAHLGTFDELSERGASRATREGQLSAARTRCAGSRSRRRVSLHTQTYRGSLALEKAGSEALTPPPPSRAAARARMPETRSAGRPSGQPGAARAPTCLGESVLARLVVVDPERRLGELVEDRVEELLREYGRHLGRATSCRCESQCEADVARTRSCSPC